mgnify:CR=1 FL=1
MPTRILLVGDDEDIRASLRRGLTQEGYHVAVAADGERALVLDADALTSVGDNPKELFTILANHKLSTAILTPHEGEFRRLLSVIDKLPSVKQKLEAALAASHETGAVVVLKGADTLVAAPDGRASPAWSAAISSTSRCTPRAA